MDYLVFGSFSDVSPQCKEYRKESYEDEIDHVQWKYTLIEEEPVQYREHYRYPHRYIEEEV